MSRDLCRECEICSAQEDGLCYYCMDGLDYGESPEVVIDQLEGSA